MSKPTKAEIDEKIKKLLGVQDAMHRKIGLLRGEVSRLRAKNMVLRKRCRALERRVTEYYNPIGLAD